MAITTVTKEDFDRLKHTYWEGRWEYFSVVCDLVKQYKPDTVLEIGANGFPLCVGSDTLDIHGTPTFKHDATKTPYPVAHYDLAIALQVWEHLGDKQAEAFNEVCRIASRVILSFPYHWDCPQDPIHHNVTDATIRKWTVNRTPELVRIVGIRAIYVWAGNSA